MDGRKRNLIYLTGFMGSGKSTIAPILANTLGYSIIDLDSEIEKSVGKKISGIFDEKGETYFRDVERSLLINASLQHGCVVSLGGGTISNDENLRVVKSSGILVYLKTDLEHIVRRLRHKDDRPLLKSDEGSRLSESELRSRVKHLLTIREPYYNQADVTINTDNQRVGSTVDEVVRSIRQLIE